MKLETSCPIVFVQGRRRAPGKRENKVKDTPQAPTGLARRRRRLSDEETGQRMLAAALAMVNATGLTVSLDHISFEDVIRDAGVSRSAVYRRWPYKDLFFSDLLRELAGAAAPAAIADEAATEQLRRFALEHLDGFETPEARHDLFVELLRRGAQQDFETIYRSKEWRTYLALHATFLGLPDGELRTDVQHGLAASERAFIHRIARSYEELAALLGYRLRPGAGATFETLAGLVSATMRGLVLTALSTPDVATRTTPAGPFGARHTDRWSQPALGIAGLACAFLEPDLTIEWNQERFAKVRAALEGGSRPATGAGRRRAADG
ncbi:TetR/AcrR family transcriptional regulator [Streptomyces sp. MST-110588]|uniref:TetR/AcrR family transcriptional regulator n=1 Tax=Streptomyces sp. MST-110588 TaxID=2833628 RepID=UPI001F5D0F7B|nr:TetR/AcrR family transcriptional regulator [Streptomyces sp. MST-110588]UNO40806.1 TetR/AcrR family transcriptional regulator [Streptomyces sp. MST-110588]